LLSARESPNIERAIDEGMSSTAFGKLSCNGAGKAPDNSPALAGVGLLAQISDAAPSLAVGFKKRLIVPSRYSPLSVTLKNELVHHRQYQTRAEARRDVFAFIDGFYSRTRLHSSIGYVAPIKMEPKAV
jgi:transposase InsO family protein